MFPLHDSKKVLKPLDNGCALCYIRSMKKRKTVDVSFIRESVNHSLANSTASDEVRYGMISVLERILHETGNYRGYGYAPIDKPFDRENFDDSRRHYY